MTICIAALCDYSKNVIAASDRMITATFPPVEFEHGTSKIETVCPTCIVLTAGDALAHADLLRMVKARVSNLSQPTVALITEEIRRAYVAQRSKTVSERFLEPRGWTLDDFYHKHAPSLTSDLVITLDHQIANYDWGLSIIVAGTDPTESHVYGVRNPGEVDCYDALGYNAIGIGAMHAISSLIANGCNSTINIKMATYLVYEAKKNAENAPGVGQHTDMVIIQNGTVNTLDNNIISLLGQIYETRRVSQTQEFQDSVANLPLP